MHHQSSSKGLTTYKINIQNWKIEKVKVKQFLKSYNQPNYLSNKVDIVVYILDKQTTNKKVQGKVVIHDKRYNSPERYNHFNCNKFLYSGNKSLNCDKKKNRQISEIQFSDNIKITFYGF